MASREKLISSYNLTYPTIPELKNQLQQSDSLGLRIIFLISQVDQNLYSFICGIVTNLPISALFNFLDMNINEMPYKWLYFTLYILLLIDIVVMTVDIFKFTLLHIKINEKARHEKVSEACTNLMYQQIFESMRTLRKIYWVFMLSFCLFILFVIALFAINNFDFSWLFDNTVEPLVTS